MPVKIGLKHIDLWNESLEKQVQKYEEETVEPGQIVFYGPSNFTRWSAKWGHRPLREVLVGNSGKACCVNRGFGSSCPEHQLYYYDRMVRPLAPSVLVYNCTNGNGGLFGYTWDAANLILLHQLQRVAYGVGLEDGHRVVDHTALGALYATHVCRLCRDRHVLVNHADATLARQSYG